MRWSEHENGLLLRVGSRGMTRPEWLQVQKRHFPDRTHEAIRFQYGVLLAVPKSEYPKYDDPLVMRRDALVLNDLEAPFHHATFVASCLALAQAWNIKGLVLGGDFLHNDALSSFEPAFMEDEARIAPELAEKFLEIVDALPKKYQGDLREAIEVNSGRSAEPDFSQEMHDAGNLLKALGQHFDEIHCCLGNHEGRILRILHTPLDPKHILKEVGIVDNPKWVIRPYYFCKVISGGETFRITHPKNTAKASAWKLADKFEEHVLMAHNHQVVMQFSMSGKYYAIETGCAVDEARLPYASQRDNTQHAHKLGAVILRGGTPWLLHERTDWDSLMRL